MGKKRKTLSINSIFPPSLKNIRTDIRDIEILQLNPKLIFFQNRLKSKKEFRKNTHENGNFTKYLPKTKVLQITTLRSEHILKSNFLTTVDTTFVRVRKYDLYIYINNKMSRYLPQREKTNSKLYFFSNVESRLTYRSKLEVTQKLEG